MEKRFFLEKGNRMHVKIEKDIGLERDMREEDVRTIKIALNKLGFYTPRSDAGVTGEAEPYFFDTIRDFQASHMLNVTGNIFSDDTTINVLNEELDSPKNFQLVKQYYIWRTVGDKDVRDSHALRAGRQFSWDNPPEGGHPGEDYGCRCWAEPIVPMASRALISKGRFTIPESVPPSDFKLTSAGILFKGATISLSACRANSVCRIWLAKRLQGVILENTYHLPPKTLPAFPDAKKVGKKGSRKRWIDSKGKIYEWDYQHGEVEIFDKTGKKHLGGFDPKTGKKRREGKPERKAKK